MYRQYEDPKSLERRLKHEKAVLLAMVDKGGFSQEAIIDQYNWVEELKERLNFAYLDEEADEYY